MSSKRLVLVLAVGASGCAGTALEPLPAGQFVGEKSDDAIDLRLSASGLGFLDQHWPLLVQALAPTGTLTVPLACAHQSLSLSTLGVTEVFVADQGGPEGGQLDGQCDARDVPASVKVAVTGLSLLAKPPSQLEVSLDLTVDTGKIFVTNPHAGFGLTCDLKCSLAFASGARAPGDNAISLGVKLVVDPSWDRLVSFKVESVDGTQVCGAQGAKAPPGCLDPTDMSMSDEGSCRLLGWACSLLDVDVVKTFVLQQLSPALQETFASLLANQSCRPCTAGALSCPTSTDGTGTVSVCASGVCADPRGGCAPRLLGVEGRADVGRLAQGLAAKVDLSIAAGGRVTVDDGVTLGTRAGVEPAEKASCVPEVAAPAPGPAGLPDLTGGATQGLEYDLALSASGGFLNRGLWAVHRAGGLCLTLNSASTSALDTGVMQAFIPSLTPLAGRDGHDAPMMAVLRPLKAPRVAIEAGGVDATGASQPVLSLVLEELAVDLYALIDDRMLRVVTITSDVSAPISFRFPGCDRLQPVLGQLALTNVHTTNSEALAEDPQGLAHLLPSMIALAQPALAQGLGAFTLPRVGGLRLTPLEVKGLGLVGQSAEMKEAMGLYARLIGPDDPACAGP